jgi:glycosyltransferase involved in cell wall biosynthesis
VIHGGLKQYLVNEIHVDPSRICVIPNGIDSGYWNRDDRESRREAMGLRDDFTFVYVGRLVQVKNVPQLILAYLDAQRQSKSSMRLIVVGDGPEMDVCKGVAAADPRGSTVTFVGEQRDTRQFLAAGDAFILNSHSEGTPRALLEAMCLGLPAICPSVGGIPELLNGCGWLTQPQSRESVREAMLAASNSPGNSAALGQRGRAFVTERYDAAQTITEYRQLLFPRAIQFNEARH